ncbi:suppressor of rasval19, partial [Teratosphaeriaceae sp. CCFEE 6253]
MEGKPSDFVGETLGGAQMYGNRVLTKHKEKDPDQVKFVQSYYTLLRGLNEYIKKHYPRGLTWNTNGVDPFEAQRELDDPSSKPTTNGSAPPPAAGAPPPPPPPLPNFDNIPGAPPPPPGGAPKAAPASGENMGAIFDQLNRGES